MNEDDVRHIKALHNMLEEASRMFNEGCYRLDPAMKKPGDTANVVDIGYYFRQMEKVCDELRKEAKARQMMAARIIAVRQYKLCAAKPKAKLLAKGNVAMASPSSKPIPIIPARGTEEHVKLCRYLGLSNQNTIDHGFLSLNWPKLRDLIAENEAHGLPMPPGLTSQNHEYTCKYAKLRKKD